jgi:xanthine/uracil permease
MFSLVSLAMEAIGDITASAEVSRLEVEGEEFDSRIQGGLLVHFSFLITLQLLTYTR